MFFFSKTIFETLPDEIILEICRYLHCSHVLYSFFDLNFRLNRTITSYYQHVWFRRASYKQLLYIYDYILPRIGSCVISLTIHPLHQSSFPLSFKDQLSNIFPNLKILTLTSWTNENLLLIMINQIEKMIYLEKLVIQELSYSGENFLEKIFYLNNQFLKTIIFDYDCDSFCLKNQTFISQNILYLTIQLDTLIDFSILIQFIPNILQLDIIIKNSSLKSVSYKTILLSLKKFSLWCIHWYSHFDDLLPLFPICPSIEQFSLTISTRDLNLMYGNKLYSILPSQLKQFHYTVGYYPYENSTEFNIENIQKSWQSIPIIYSINEDDKRIFLHTLPYSSSRLMIRSSLAKNMPTNDIYEMYSNIDQIQIYTITNLSEIFPVLKQCRRVRELTLLITNETNTTDSETKPSANNNKQVIKLPYLNRLDILTIEGIPSDLYNLKELLLVASNLSVLVIDLDCLLTLIEDENISLIIYSLLNRHILDLCIRSQESNIEQTKKSKLTLDHIYLIARIFTRVRNFTIDYETSDEDIQINIIKSVLNHFKQLVIFHIYGKIPKEMLENDIRQWIIQENPLRIKSTDIFRVECSKTWFKLWL